MRYQPIATALVRAAAQDFEMGGYRVEKGSVIYMVRLCVICMGRGRSCAASMPVKT